MLENITITGVVTLREIRAIFAMNQKGFAEFLDIPLSSYQRYERDMWSMDVKTLVHITEKTGIPIEKFKLA